MELKKIRPVWKAARKNEELFFSFGRLIIILCRQIKTRVHGSPTHFCSILRFQLVSLPQLSTDLTSEPVQHKTTSSEYSYNMATEGYVKDTDFGK